MISNLETISKNYKKAIDHLDDKLALETIKLIDAFSTTKKLESTNQNFFQKLQKAKLNLKIVAFPKLTVADAVSILTNHYLESFAINIPMENRISLSLFSESYTPRNELRKKFKKALRENQQRIGKFTISKWIELFEKESIDSDKPDSAVINFLKNNSELIQLPTREKMMLEEILHAYDYYLVATLPATGPALDNLLNSSESNLEEATMLAGEDYSKPQGLFEENKTENQIEINLNEALQKYPEINEQLITSEMIKIQNNPKSVRPSVKNWLADYFFNLGNESHDSIQRGKYLFQSLNGKKLSNIDRQRLAFILKAQDENSSLRIDLTSKKILFPRMSAPTNPALTQKNVPAVQPQKTALPPQNFSPRKIVSEKKPVSIPTSQPTKNDFATQKNQHLTSNSSQKTKQETEKTEEKPTQKDSFYSFKNSKEGSGVNTAKPISQKNSMQDSLHNIRKASFSSPQKMVSEKEPIPQEKKPELLNENGPISAEKLNQEKMSFSEELQKMKAASTLKETQKKDNSVNVVNLKDLT